jgi:hypothetical protein
MRINHSLFQIGYLNEKSRGNVDIEMYNDSFGELQNIFPKVTGGLFKRTGTRCVDVLTGNNVGAPYNLHVRSFPFFLGEQRINVLFFLRRNAPYAYISAKFFTIDGSIKVQNQDFVADIIRIRGTDKQISDLLTNMVVFQGAQTLFITFGADNLPDDFAAEDDIGHFITIKKNSDDNIPYAVSPLRYSFVPFGEAMPYALRPTDAKNVENGTCEIRLYGNKSSYKITESDNQKYEVEVTYVYLSNAEATRLSQSLPGKLVMLSYDGGENKPTESWCLTVTSASSEMQSPGNYYLKLQCTVLPDLCPKAAKGGVQPLPTYIEPTALEGEANTNNILVFRWNCSLITANDSPIQKITDANPTNFEMHDNRLFVSGSKQAPTFIWGSSRSKNDWFDFTPGVNSGDGIREKLTIRYSENVHWIIDGPDLFLGTKEGIYAIRSTDHDAISPVNFRSERISPIAASKIKPVLGQSGVFFVDASQRSLYEIIKDQNGEYDTNEISLLSDDLMQKKIIKLAYANSPNKLLFVLLDDGTFCTLSYLKTNGMFPWAYHNLGGNCVIMDLHVAPDSEGDIVWFTTKRLINGTEKICIEYLKDKRKLDENYYVDFGKEFELTFNVIAAANRDQLKISSNQNIFSFLLDQDHRKVIFHALPENDPQDPNDRAHLVSGPLALDYMLLQQIDPNQYVVKDRWQNNCIAMEISGNTHSFRCDVNLFVETTVQQWIIEDNHLLLKNLTKPPNNVEIEVKFIDTHLKDHNGVYIDYNAQPGEIWSVDENNDPTYSAKPFYLQQVGNTNDYLVFLDDEFTDQLTLMPESMVNPNATLFIFASVPLITIPTGAYRETQLMLQNNISLDQIPLTTLYSSRVKINKIVNVPLENLHLLAYASTQNTNILKIAQIIEDDYGNPRAIPLDLNAEISRNFITFNCTLIQFFGKITGLQYLAGETVSINTNGNTSLLNTVVPENGEISFQNPVYYAAIGYNINSRLRKLPPAFQSPYLGTTVGIAQHQRNALLLLYKSLGGKFGSNEKHLLPIQYRRLDNGTIINNPEKPFSGYVTLTLDSVAVTESTLHLEHSEPTPFNVLSITSDVNVSDGAPETS